MNSINFSYGRAAEGGHNEARYSLGVCYMKGCGVAADPVLAYECFERAAAAGSERGRRALQKLARRLDAATLARARQRRET